MKTTKTYSIDDKTYQMFDLLCKKNSINKSSFIESCIKKYLKENLGFDIDDLYQLKENRDYIVSILDRDETYFDLSDGSRIPQILFYQIYELFPRLDSDEFFNKKNALNKIADVIEKTKETEEKWDIKLEESMNPIENIQFKKEVKKETFEEFCQKNGILENDHAEDFVIKYWEKSHNEPWPGKIKPSHIPYESPIYKGYKLR
jgi:hypothetical protein